MNDAAAADDRFARLASDHELGDDPIPPIVVARAGGDPIELVWRSEVGGLTFRAGDRFVKFNPNSTGIDLERERVRLDWLAGRVPVPVVLEFGADNDAQWLVTRALDGEMAVGDTWRARRPEAVAAIATGLRAVHAVDVSEFPSAWLTDSWVDRQPAALGPRPPIERPVLVHGDACAPNTLINQRGHWCGVVDVGDLGVGDHWADLAIASLSLDWNFGEGHQHELFDAYGIEPDEERIAYYRALWDLES